MIQSIKKLLPDAFKNNVNKFIYKIFTPPQIQSNYHSMTFSQAGEDCIVNYLLQSLGIYQPSYLDIGANQPIYGNNTYLFYLKGGKGVCIEPDPSVFLLLEKERPRDECLNIVINTGSVEEELDFYIFSESSLNTLSKEEAMNREKDGTHKIKDIIKVKAKNINQVFKEYFKTAPDFLSIDVEGLDYEILNSIDFALYRPIVICTETIAYSETAYKEKIPMIQELLESKGYLVFGDTHINTIFVDGNVYYRLR